MRSRAIKLHDVLRIHSRKHKGSRPLRRINRECKTATRRTYLIFTILYFCAPFGVSNENTSPFFFSISAEPKGERCDILWSCMFASAEPTISYVCSSFSPCF